MDEFEKDARPDKRLAVVFTGGGARGPYEGGVVEGLVQEFHRRRLQPDVVCGASVGAINALCLFVDTMFPRTAPDPATHFLARQSSMWAAIGQGANGATQVVDKPWLIEYLSGKKPIPGLGDLEEAWQQLTQAWQATKQEVASVGPAAASVLSALDSADTSQLFNDISAAATRISNDASAISTDWSNLTNAWASVHMSDLLAHPHDFEREIENFASSIEATATDIPGLIFDLVKSAVAIGIDDIQALMNYISGLVTAVKNLVQILGNVVLDSGRLAGDLAKVEMWLAVLLAVAVWILSNLDWLFITVVTAAGTFVALADHVLDNVRIINLMRSFITNSMMAAGVSSPGHIIDFWKAEVRSGKKAPGFYISTTDLTADRLVIFALDDRARLEGIANEGTWVVDLAAQAGPVANLFTPVPDRENDLLPIACMTSSSVPFVFPPIKWHLNQLPQPNQPHTIKHVFVDGGVVDNTPLDLAIFAEATHIISVELTPLLDYEVFFDPIDTSMDNMVGVGGRSFSVAMDGSLLRSITDVVEMNAQLPANERLHIYRLAPLIPKSAPDSNGDTIQISPGIVDFDGVFNSRHHVVMNLFDWFIQGYVDAQGWDQGQQATAFADPIVAAYLAAAGSAQFVKAPVLGGNRFWRVEGAALPQLGDIRPPTTLPNRTQLADTARLR